jgi:hypothetical protein
MGIAIGHQERLVPLSAVADEGLPDGAEGAVRMVRGLSFRNSSTCQYSSKKRSPPSPGPSPVDDSALRAWPTEACALSTSLDREIIEGQTNARFQIAESNGAVQPKSIEKRLDELPSDHTIEPPGRPQEILRNLIVRRKSRRPRHEADTLKSETALVREQFPEQSLPCLLVAFDLVIRLSKEAAVSKDAVDLILQ